MAYNWLTTNDPDQTTTDTAYLQKLQPIETSLSIYMLQSELHGDGNPLTAERLKEDAQSILLVLENLTTGTVDDLVDEMRNANATDDEINQAVNIWLWIKASGGDDDNTKYIKLGTALSFGAKYVSEGISKGDTEEVLAGGQILLGGLTLVAGDLVDAFYEPLKKLIEKLSEYENEMNNSSGGGDGGAF